MSKTVLIVEDDEFIRADLTELLELEGYRTMSCSNGLEATNLLATARPDVILLDLMMPIMDGYALLHWLEANGELAAVPVLVMSATGQAENRLDLRRSDFLKKPLDVEKLLAAVELRAA